ALIVIFGSYYQVEPDEVGLVTRFGRYVRTTTPGPHSKIPFGIEQVTKVPVERQLKQEFGFRTDRADIQSTFHKDEKTIAEPLMPSFNAVNQAIQERERAINEAWAEYNQEIPRARGLAEQKIQGAEGYAVDRVNRAKGDAQRFIALQEEYRKAPEVTRTRIYLETLTAVLPAAGKKLIFDD